MEAQLTSGYLDSRARGKTARGEDMTISTAMLTVIYGWYAFIAYYFMIAGLQEFEAKRINKPRKKDPNPLEATIRYQQRATDELQRRNDRPVFRPMIIGILLIVLTLPLHTSLLWAIDQKSSTSLISTDPVSFLSLLVFVCVSTIDEITLGFFSLFPNEYVRSDTIIFDIQHHAAAVFSLVFSKFILVGIGFEKLGQFVTARVGMQFREYASTSQLKKIVKKSPEDLMNHLKNQSWFEDPKSSAPPTMASGLLVGGGRLLFRKSTTHTVSAGLAPVLCVPMDD